MKQMVYSSNENWNEKRMNNKLTKSWDIIILSPVADFIVGIRFQYFELYHWLYFSRPIKDENFYPW